MLRTNVVDANLPPVIRRTNKNTIFDNSANCTYLSFQLRFASLLVRTTNLNNSAETEQITLKYLKFQRPKNLRLEALVIQFFQPFQNTYQFLFVFLLSLIKQLQFYNRFLFRLK